MSQAPESASLRRHSANHDLFLGVARAFGGAIFFSMPLLMTMEMWWLGFYMSRLRLALLLVLFIPVLIALDHYSGFKNTESWREDAVDGIIAYGIGFVAAAATLSLFSVLDTEMPVQEIVGKIALQAVPASFGAVLANSQLRAGGGGEEEKAVRRKREAGYGATLLFMASGAIFFAFNVAPTEEMILIGFKMTHWHTVVLSVVTLAMMHAFVYGVEFGGTPSAPEGTPWWSLFLRFTVVGYALALLISAYILWTFGRFENHAFSVYMTQTVVLGFPAGLGAAAARLIL